MDYGRLRTSLREVLEILPYRKDKKRMMELNSREAYRSLDCETMEVITVMTRNTRQKAEEYLKADDGMVKTP